MKRGVFVWILAIVAVLSVFSGCKKKSSSEESNYAKGYTGSIIFEYKRDFPKFDAKTYLPVTVNSSGILSSGASVSYPIVADDILVYNDGGKLRIKLNGSMTFHEAEGNTITLNGVQYMLVLLHTTIQYQETVWVWIKQEQKWQQTIDAPFTHSDEYGNGTYQFSMVDAQLSGSYIGATLPDLQGSFTYGYTLFLIPNP